MIVGVTMPFEHDPAAAKGIRYQAIRACHDIAALNLSDAIRLNEVPVFAAGALFKPGQHQLRSHRAITDETTLTNRVEQGRFHDERPRSANSISFQDIFGKSSSVESIFA
jgi:hypothetical protein